MKRCPECRQDYYDDTLLYCLDDGTRLLDGPAAAIPRWAEPATAILYAKDISNSSPDQTAKKTNHSKPEILVC